MLDFPNAPTMNQVFTSGSSSWRWDGTKWVVDGVMGGTTPAVPVMLVTGTTTLPTNYVGFVRVENAAGAPITVTLPTAPYSGQNITIKDSLGNATTYAITISGGAATIEGVATLVLSFSYSWAELLYTGTKWVQM